MKQVSWIGTHYTHQGKVRTINEDSVLNHNDEQLWVVADGMGGHAAGDFASQMLVRELASYHVTPARGAALAQLESLLANCNDALLEKATTDNSDIIGSTVAILSIHGSHVVTTWSGDSRVYRLRGGKLMQLTRDHTYQSLSEDRDLNYFPQQFPGDDQMLTSAIGGGQDTQIEHCWFELQHTDRFLLCTDGLYKEVTQSEIADAMQSELPPEKILARLANAYLDRGARDNIGMIMVAAATGQGSSRTSRKA